MVLARRLAHNAATAFVVQSALAALGIGATAVFVRVLGADGFGAWSLILAVVAYGGLFDLGLGVALVRRVAVAHAAADRAALSLAIGATVTATVLLGALAAGAIAVFADPIARLVRVGPDGRDAFVAALRLSGWSVSLMLPGIALGAVPTALQRLDAVLRLEAAVTAATLALQTSVALAGGGLVGLAAAALVGRGASLLGRAWLIRRLLGGFPFRLELRYPFWSQLGRFGFLKVVHQLASQLVLHLDRFLVATLVSVPAVAFYTVALELAQKLLLVQGTVASAFYPAACAAATEVDRSTLLVMYERTSRVVALATYALAAVLVVWAEPALELWVGETFAARSADLLRLLAVAYAGMALTAIPSTAADALDRPDISARYGLLGLGINLMLALLLIPRWGILGAGFAILGNVLLQAPWFIRAVTREIVGAPVLAYARRAIGEPLLPAVTLGGVLAATGAVGLGQGIAGLLAAAAAGLGAFALALRFLGVFDAGERRLLGELPGGRVLQWLTGK